MTDNLSPEARQKYTAYYSDLLNKRLNWALQYVRENRQPVAIQEHIQTWLQILRACHRPGLQASAATLISLLHPWPLHWGYWADWEQELNFAIDGLNALQTSEDQADFLTNLANVMYLTGRRDDALNLSKRAVSIAIPAHAVVALAKSGILAVSILLGKNREVPESITSTAESILNSIEQEIANQTAEGKNTAKIATARAYYISYKARQLFQANQGDMAMDLIDDVISQLKQIPEIDPNVLADAVGIRSNFYWGQDKYALAIEDLNLSIELVSAAGYGFAESAFRGNLGVCYWTICELKQAEETLRRCIRLAEQSRINYRLAYDVGNLALVFLSQGRIEEAVVMSERHIALAKDNSSPEENMRALDNYGLIKFHAGDYAAAETALKQNIPVYEKKKLKTDLIIQLASLSRCYAALGKIDQAINTSEITFNYAQQQSYQSPKITALRSLAEFRSPENSKLLLLEALDLARQLHRPLDEAACLLSLAALEQNIKEQRRLWREGSQLLNTIGASAWLKGCSPKRPPQIPIL